MTIKLMGKKRGMTQLFDDKGNVVICTVIQAEPNVVTQIKTDDTDGYVALQLGFDKVKGKNEYTVGKRTGKPLAGHFKKGEIAPRRHLTESRIDSAEGYSVGQEIGVEAFEGIEFVDATAMSKGKGYQGVMKRYHFAGGPASHGSGFHRHGGSTGMRSTPGRGLPGMKKAGHMGYEQVTVQNLRVVRIDKEDNLIIVKGQVPGPRNGLVYLRQAKKRMATKKK